MRIEWDDGGYLTGMTKSSLWASSLMGKERPYRSLGSLARGLPSSVCCDLLVLENHDRVRVADSSLQQTLGVLGAVWRNDLQSRNASVPRSVILRMLCSDTGSETVGATEGDVAGLDTTGHVVGLCGGVDNLVNGLHGEVEGHELALSSLSDLLFLGHDD